MGVGRDGFQAVACEVRPSVNLGTGTHDHYFGCHAPTFLRDALLPPAAGFMPEGLFSRVTGADWD